MSEKQGEWSVWQFYTDRSYKRVKDFVSAESASASALDLVNSAGGLSGAIHRVIITDAGDCINFEWEFGKGVTFPKVGEINEHR